MAIKYIKFLVFLIFITFQANASDVFNQGNFTFPKGYHSLANHLFQEFATVEMSIAALGQDQAYGYVALRHHETIFPDFHDRIQLSPDDEIMTSDPLVRLFLTHSENGTLLHPNSSVLKMWIDLDAIKHKEKPLRFVQEALSDNLYEIEVTGIPRVKKSFSWTRDPQWTKKQMQQMAKVNNAKLVVSSTAMRAMRFIKH